MAGKATIAVAGLGFVGLTTALGFADRGFQVLAFDAAPARLAGVREGRVDFHEPFLPEKLVEHLGKNLRITGSLHEAVAAADVVFICVGTPTSDEGMVDTRYVEQAVAECLPAVGDRFVTVIIKSTVPPGTCARVVVPVLERAGRKIGETVGLASNPEFLREGIAWEDFTKPDRIVVGAGDDRSFEAVAALYADFGAEVLRVSLSTAEFIKSSSNAFLATMISFANECARTADAIGGIDVRAAFAALHRDRRWSGAPAKMSTYYYPGCGYGGYCLPKDTVAFAHAAEQAGAPAEVLRAVIATNASTRLHFAERIAKATPPGQPVGILGLSFKTGSDDVRDTPALHIIRDLLARGLQVVAYDPMANEAFANAYQLPIEYAPDLDTVAARCGTIAVLTAWPEFRAASVKLAGKTVIDGRYFLELP